MLRGASLTFDDSSVHVDVDTFVMSVVVSSTHLRLFEGLLLQLLLELLVACGGPMLLLRFFLQLFAQLSVQDLLPLQLLLTVRQQRRFGPLQIQRLELLLLAKFD